MRSVFLGCSCFSLKDSQMAAVLPFINAEHGCLIIQEWGCTMGVMNFFRNNRSDQRREYKIQKTGRTSRLEQMEDRIMLSAAPWTPDIGTMVEGPSKCDVEVSFSSDTVTLKIVGSSCDDHVSVESGTFGMDVIANGETTHFTPVVKGSVDLITFIGTDGDDHFEHTTGKDTWAFGGDGDDTIQTSSGDDWVSGDDGMT